MVFGTEKILSTDRLTLFVTTNGVERFPSMLVPATNPTVADAHPSGADIVRTSVRITDVPEGI